MNQEGLQLRGVEGTSQSFSEDVGTEIPAILGLAKIREIPAVL